MAQVRCDNCGAVNSVRRGMAPEEQSLPTTNICRQCGGQIVRAGGALWRPLPSRPSITQLCCVNCGVENSVFTPTNNLCCGCGRALFRPPHPKTSKTDGLIGGIIDVLFYGINGIAILVVGGGWLIGLALLILALPFYALFYWSPPVGVVAVILLAGWLLHRLSRPESIARRQRRKQRRRIQRELTDIGDDLPV